MAISAKLVKELRDKTGAGMMDCKKALTETDPDFFLWAADWLQRLLQANRDKRIYDQTAMAQIVFKMWVRIAIKGWRTPGLAKTYALNRRLNALVLAYLRPPYS